MNFYTREGFLTPDTCRFIVDRFVKEGFGETTSSRESVRSSRIQWLLPERVPVIAEAMMRANEVAFQFDVRGGRGLEPLQLAEYIEGDHYDWHLDIGLEKYFRRKLSASIQLSDPSDYDGGELELWGAPSLPKSQGTLIVFPSYQLHRVTPVTRGRRLSLVAWMSGSTSFR